MMVIATLVATGCGRAERPEAIQARGEVPGPEDAFAYEYPQEDLEADLGLTEGERRHLEVTDPEQGSVSVTVHRIAGESYVELTGTHDLLEGWMPVGESAEIIQGSRHGRGIARHGREYLFVGDPGTPPGVVSGRAVVIGPAAEAADSDTLSDRFSTVGWSIAEGSQQSEVIERGDLSMLTGGVAGELISYPGESSPSLRIYTYPDRRVDPVLAHLAPLFEPLEVDGGPAYRFGSVGNQARPLSVMANGPDGGLVMASSPDGSFDIDDLVTVLGKVRKEER